MHALINFFNILTHPFVAQGLLTVFVLLEGFKCVKKMPSIALRRVSAVLLFLLFIYAFYAHVCVDIRYLFVMQNNHPAQAIHYRIASLWSHHETSLFVWLVILNATTYILRLSPDVAQFRRRILGLLNCLLGFYMLMEANPFATTPLALLTQESQGLNPLLYDMNMVWHPPLLYLGVTWLFTPYVLSLWLYRTGDVSLVPLIQHQTKTAFGVLTLAIALGSFWAFTQLGWGGFWFWDPVETASLLPWVAALIVFHCTSVTFKKYPWIGCLPFAAVSLSLWAVRSGILISVHSFANDIMAFWLLGALMVFAWMPVLVLAGSSLRKLGSTASVTSTFHTAIPTFHTAVPAFHTAIPTFYTAIPTFHIAIPTSHTVIPAQAGIHTLKHLTDEAFVDSRLRGNDMGHSWNGMERNWNDMGRSWNDKKRSLDEKKRSLDDKKRNVRITGSISFLKIGVFLLALTFLLLTLGLFIPAAFDFSLSPMFFNTILLPIWIMIALLMVLAQFKGFRFDASTTTALLGVIFYLMFYSHLALPYLLLGASGTICVSAMIPLLRAKPRVAFAHMGIGLCLTGLASHSDSPSEVTLTLSRNVPVVHNAYRIAFEGTSEEAELFKTNQMTEISIHINNTGSSWQALIKGRGHPEKSWITTSPSTLRDDGEGSCNSISLTPARQFFHSSKLQRVKADFGLLSQRVVLITNIETLPDNKIAITFHEKLGLLWLVFGCGLIVISLLLIPLFPLSKRLIHHHQAECS